MTTFAEAMDTYHEQLQKGSIQVAYKGLMDYMMALRTHLEKKYPDYVVSGSIYPGYMDMTYFSLFPRALKERNLKIAIVFLHEAFRFEVWLSGFNRQVQVRYWKLIQDCGWTQYRLAPNPKTADSIVEHILVETPVFSDLDALSAQIEAGTLSFIRDVVDFLAPYEI